jgi:hypothetical protein
MKQLRRYSGLSKSCLIVTLVIFSSNCTKTIHDRRPTTTNSPESREYFGFVLNGRHFISEESEGNVSGSATYVLSYNSASTFKIVSSHSKPNCVGGTIEIILDSINLKEGSTYSFGTPGRGKNYLTCSFANECSKPAMLLSTRDGSFGFLKIKKYQPDKKVIIAVFSCIVINDAGQTLQIADGYFDRHYTSL